jgi:TonB family protein
MTHAVLVAVAIITSMVGAGRIVHSHPAGIASSGAAVLRERVMRHRAVPVDEFTRYASVDTAAIRRKIVYPATALHNQIAGRAVLTIAVSPSAKGTISNANGTTPEFVDALRKALKGARYTAARINNKPVNQTLVLTARFRIIKDGEAVRGGIKLDMAIVITDGSEVAVAGSGTLFDEGDGMAGNGTMSGEGTGSPDLVSVSPQTSTPESMETLERTEGPFPQYGDYMPVDQEPTFDQTELLSHVKYPEVMRRNGIEGKVIVRALVGRSGRVVKTETDEGGNKDFETAAINGIKATRFTPARKNGSPVAVWIQVPVMFSLGH